jgi:sarcosine/dimethylglycine N-methyltransferase
MAGDPAAVPRQHPEPAMSLDRQYATGLSRHRIEEALVAAGRDLNTLQPGDLAPLEDFHTMGRIATSQLAELAAIERCDEVLDAGSGIGGTARYLAGQFGCHVTAVDLTEEYCDTSRWLNQLVGLDASISVQRADVTDVPFPPASFTVVFSQHVQMNVADKAALYDEARRVLRPRGRLAIWDITAGTPGDLDYPLPWADQPALSHLTSGEHLRATIESSGFSVTHWNDTTEDAVTIMKAFLSAPPGPLGLHIFVDRFAEKANNLVRGLSSGRLRAIQAIAKIRS